MSHHARNERVRMSKKLNMDNRKTQHGVSQCETAYLAMCDVACVSVCKSDLRESERAAKERRMPKYPLHDAIECTVGCESVLT